MSVVEFIGFAVSLAAMIFLIIKQYREQLHRRNHPAEDHEDESDLEKLLKSLNPTPGHLPTPPHEKNKPKTPPKSPPLSHTQPQKKHSSHNPIHSKSPKDTRPKKLSTVDESFYPAMSDPWKSGESKAHSAYDIIHKSRKSYASNMIHKLPSKKYMVAIHEIFGQPKSMRRSFWDE